MKEWKNYLLGDFIAGCYRDPYLHSLLNQGCFCCFEALGRGHISFRDITSAKEKGTPNGK